MPDVNLSNPEPDFDTDEDRYPEFLPAVRRLVEEADIPDGPVERVEMTFQANGEANLRVWRARALEPDTVHLSAP